MTIKLITSRAKMLPETQRVVDDPGLEGRPHAVRAGPTVVKEIEFKIGPGMRDVVADLLGLFAPGVDLSPLFDNPLLKDGTGDVIMQLAETPFRAPIAGGFQTAVAATWVSSINKLPGNSDPK